MSPEELTAAHRRLRDRLFDAGLLLPSGIDGLYGRNEVFESVVSGFSALVKSVGSRDRPIKLDFPPLIPKTTFDRIGYLRNFPHLVGPVFSFEGGDREHIDLLHRLDNGEAYDELMTQSEVAITPACCYPLYPTLRGTVAAGGVLVETCSYCFRHEPSLDPMRLQAFRQLEHVRVATPDEVLDWRATWLQRAAEILESLGLVVRSDIATDAFFGRAGRVMASSQREQQLKIEFLVSVHDDDHPTACASINYHQDHFGQLFDIKTVDGADAHSSCIGFGLERCAVALLSRHGVDVDAWPSSVKDRLWP
jgi:seryl-tRNA synthetase